jgi:hypothetical protein
MRFNIKKTKHMFINPNENEQDITLYGQKLERVDNYKYLGVIINNELNHNIHWDKVSTTNKQPNISTKIAKTSKIRGGNSH